MRTYRIRWGSRDFHKRQFCDLQFQRVACKLPPLNPLPRGVMVAQEILNLFVKVRVLARQLLFSAPGCIRRNRLLTWNPEPSSVPMMRPTDEIAATRHRALRRKAMDREPSVIVEPCTQLGLNLEFPLAVRGDEVTPLRRMPFHRALVEHLQIANQDRPGRIRNPVGNQYMSARIWVHGLSENHGSRVVRKDIALGVFTYDLQKPPPASGVRASKLPHWTHSV